MAEVWGGGWAVSSRKLQLVHKTSLKSLGRMVG